MNDTVTTVAASSLVAAAAPYIVAVLVAIVIGLIGFAAKAFTKYTGIQIKQSAIDNLDAMAKAEAGALVAAASDNLATKTINVGSPIVAQVVNKIVMAAPGLMKDAGLTPDAVGTMVAGHIGALQATMTVAAPMQKS